MNKKNNRSLFLNLTQDLMFKIYFSKDEQVLKFLLNTFLPLPPGKSVQDVSFLEGETQQPYQEDTEHTKHTEHKKIHSKRTRKKELTILDSSLYPYIHTNKQIIMDLRVQLNTGEKVNVEMQSMSKKGFLSRVLFYWARLYTEDLKKAEEYQNICPVYSLIFTDFDVFKPEQFKVSGGKKSLLKNQRERRSFINSFSLRLDDPPHFGLSDDLRIVFVELSRFQREYLSELNNMFDFRDLWCYILKKSNSISVKECKILSKKGEEMKRAVEHLRDLSQDEVLRREEEAREKFLMDQKAEKAYAFDEGLEKGMEKGRQQGMQKGRQEERRAVALNILRKNLDISFISEVTGLSEEEIKDLKKRLKT